ncbi:MAG TPA: electron transfer flavoprotein subunit alpha/FixB family protein [Acidimicrobiales bacterium]|nr:MAG: electron transfer flavoprotein subunit alpha [Actinobacteria bacterium 21-64-8]HQT98866.1 electron transfer flavoprotein subunit alpha/FixB family protein [Acidimicrobiales bacterium]
MSISSLWVVAEPSNGSFTTTSLELLTQARALSASVSVITWGDGASLAAQAGEYGASTLFDVGSLEGALPGAPVASAIAGLVATKGAPAAILIPTSYDGRDIAGRLSARLNRTVLTNVTGLVDDGALTTEHPVFGGTQIVRARFSGEGPGLIVVRAKSFAAEPSGGPAPVVESAPVGELGTTGSAVIVNSHVEEREGPKLEEAPVVVSGGRGLGEASQYALIEEAAKLLNGAAGASRAIVDAGWVPYSHQVGQTGKTVKPTVYIACGISGATQHMVGMKGSKNIVAINKDADAPIFQIADLGIVGDVHQVLPALIAALRARN